MTTNIEAFETFINGNCGHTGEQFRQDKKYQWQLATGFEAWAKSRPDAKLPLVQALRFARLVNEVGLVPRMFIWTSMQNHARKLLFQVHTHIETVMVSLATSDSTTNEGREFYEYMHVGQDNLPTWLQNHGYTE